MDNFNQKSNVDIFNFEWFWEFLGSIGDLVIDTSKDMVIDIWKDIAFDGIIDGIFGS